MSGKKVKKGHPFAALRDVKLEPKAQPAAPRPRKAPKVSAQDEELAFHRMMAGVTPMRGKSRMPRSVEVPQPSAEKKAAQRAQLEPERDAEDARSRLDGLVKTRFEVRDDGRRAEGRRVETPPAVLRQLKQGRFPIDARLDVRALPSADARVSIDAFLRKMRSRGERCVLVAYGAEEGKTLRGEVTAWLSQGATSAQVSAFATPADDEHAVVILLRR